MSPGDEVGWFCVLVAALLPAYDGGRSVNMGPRLRRTWPQRAFLGLNCLLVVSALAAAAMLAYADNTVSRVQRVSLGHVLNGSAESAVAGQERNFLIVGVDSSEGLDSDDPVTNGRDNTGLLSDTLMLVRVDPSLHEVSMLSIPRDLWVPIAPSWSYARINAALAFGGPDMLVETVQAYFNVQVHHYVEVDFHGFKQLVAAIDGVPIEASAPMRDRRSGLFIAEPGCVVLDPDQALAYVRSRAYESYDGTRWEYDPRGDLGRIERQQQFLQLSLARAIDKGLRNPFTLDQLIKAGLGNVTVDENLGTRELADLGRQLRHFEPANLHTYTLPVDAREIARQQVLSLRIDQAQPTLDVFRGAVPDTLTAVAPGVRVHVLNGSGTSGQADRAGEALQAADFDVVSVANASSFDFAHTTVQYPPGLDEAAQLLASRLQPAPTVVEVADLPRGSLVVVIGLDHIGVQPFSIASASASASGLARTEPEGSAVTNDLDERSVGRGDDSLVAAGDTVSAATVVPVQDGSPVNAGDDAAVGTSGNGSIVTACS